MRTEDAEDICQLLLGWFHRSGEPPQYWYDKGGRVADFTPDFLVPVHAQLMIDAIVARRLGVKLEYNAWSVVPIWRVMINAQWTGIAGGEGCSWPEALQAAVLRWIDLVKRPWPGEPPSMHELRSNLLNRPG